MYPNTIRPCIGRRGLRREDLRFNTMDTQVLGTRRLAEEVGASGAKRRKTFTKALFFAGKLIVSAACFWYALRQTGVRALVTGYGRVFRTLNSANR